MRIGVFHIGGTDAHRAVAALMLASARRAMPTVPVWHLTDATTPALDGFDGMERQAVSPHVALACLEAYAACDGEWLFVDTDVLIQRDVRHVFDQAFDIAVSERAGTLKDCEVGTKFMAANPYNKGAVFSRCSEFWRQASELLRGRSEKQQAWMGDQRAMCDVIASDRYRVQVLPNDYNYPPKSRDEDVSGKAVLHFKGPRKAWLLARAA